VREPQGWSIAREGVKHLLVLKTIEYVKAQMHVDETWDKGDVPDELVDATANLFGELAALVEDYEAFNDRG
jgi:hypothetical protein